MSIQAINHIEITSGVMGGRPRIAGRRILVADIATLHEKSGWSVERICKEFDLTPGQIHAALSYYFDHRKEIEQSIRDEESFAEAYRSKYPSPLDEKLAKRRADKNDKPE